MDLSYFKKRATVRKYKNKEIPESLLTEMLEDAMRAPTTGGMQVYSAIVTTDKTIKEQLAPCHFNQPQVNMAPAVITFCADFNRFCKWCEASNAVPGYNNFQSFMTAVLDATIYAQQFNTIAEMNGLGCCYLGTTTYNADKIAEVLNLPKMVIPIVTITVGYPEGDVYQVERIPVSGIIHKEKYQNYSDADIKEVFYEKEALEVNKGYVKENNKETLAQVFTDIRYPKGNNELFSKVFFDFIEKAGYPFPEK